MNQMSILNAPRSLAESPLVRLTAHPVLPPLSGDCVLYTKVYGKKIDLKKNSPIVSVLDPYYYRQWGIYSSG